MPLKERGGTESAAVRKRCQRDVVHFQEFADAIEANALYFSSHGSAYHYLAELPLFGRSENHAMIQLADWVGSAFLAPMATTAYCSAYKGTCVHVAPEFDEIRDRFGQRIKKLQYRFEREGSKLGGIHVLGGKDIRLNTLQLFGDPPAEA